MNFEDFIKDGKVRKATPDKLMAESIIKNTFDDLKFLDGIKLNELSKRKIVSNYYDSLRSLLEVISLLKGYKIYSHEAFTYFLKEKLNQEILSFKFDRFRKIRNGLIYYGKSIQLEEAEDIVKEIKIFIEEINKKFIKK
ncbi:MAG TPA: hypothetical protein VJH65_03060 [Candidatus Nanoarchaeia archaeon]|nr:hypothetical protein [Candidatus Nanoarchaeia archaeon]